ncbi:MAG TPA: PA14 domain-containing protein [Saprospiraceae bacterium]|nr:PA14 domain-containing protein [Saprospiraceae bacterium]
MKKTTWLALSAFLYSIHLFAQQGLVGEYYDGSNFERKVMTRNDQKISFVWNMSAPAPGMDPSDFSVRWKGRIKTPESGNYLFRAHVDDGIRVKVGNQMVINAWGMHDSEPFSGTVYLEAGQMYDLQVEYFNGLLEGEIQLYWQLPSEAPRFGGLLGYNDKIIDGKYFYKPPSEVPATNGQAASNKPVVAPKPTAPKPAQPKPATQKPTVQKPAKPVAAQPAEIPKDTLEKYIPKNILFTQGKSIMLPESEPELNRLAGYLVRNPAVQLTIEGHTDNHGDSAKNLVLSKERAKVVAEYLSGKGVAARRIRPEGYGDTRPLQTIASGNVKNRRVEFLLHY